VRYVWSSGVVRYCRWEATRKRKQRHVQLVVLHKQIHHERRDDPLALGQQRLPQARYCLLSPPYEQWVRSNKEGGRSAQVGVRHEVWAEAQGRGARGRAGKAVRLLCVRN
jgi:hypothetical protein